MRLLLSLIFCLAPTLPVLADTPLLRLISVPDWINADVAYRAPRCFDLSESDPDYAEKRQIILDARTRAGVTVIPYHPGDANNDGIISVEEGYRGGMEVLFEAVAAENPDAVLISGDFIDGSYLLKTNGATLAEKQDFVREQSAIYYGAWVQHWTEYGLPDLFTVIGDHEIGDDGWSATKASEVVGPLLEEYVYYMNLPGTRGTGGYMNAPRGMEGRVWCRQVGPVLLIGLETFEILEDGAGGIVAVRVTYTDDSKGSGSKITKVPARQVVWLNTVLAKAASDPSITHRVVLGHCPINVPGNQARSSSNMQIGNVETVGGELLKDNEAHLTDFWQTLSHYDVDLYLAGEVHQVYGQLTEGVLQFVSGGNFFNVAETNYLIIEVHPDRMDLILKEIPNTFNGDRHVKSDAFNEDKSKSREWRISAGNLAAGWSTSGTLTLDTSGVNTVAGASGRLGANVIDLDTMPDPPLPGPSDPVQVVNEWETYSTRTAILEGHLLSPGGSSTVQVVWDSDPARTLADPPAAWARSHTFPATTEQFMSYRLPVTLDERAFPDGATVYWRAFVDHSTDGLVGSSDIRSFQLRQPQRPPSAGFADEFSGLVLDPAWDGSGAYTHDPGTGVLNLDTGIGDDGRSIHVQLGKLANRFSVSSDFTFSYLGQNKLARWGFQFLDLRTPSKISNSVYIEKTSSGTKWGLRFRNPDGETTAGYTITPPARTVNAWQTGVTYTFTVVVDIHDNGNDTVGLDFEVSLSNGTDTDSSTLSLSNVPRTNLGTWFGYMARPKDDPVSGITGSMDNFRIDDLSPPTATSSGIPHTWLERYGLPTDDSVESLDDDHDGRTTLGEWLADTSPVDGASFFNPRIEQAGSPDWAMRFPHTRPDRIYRVEYSPDLRESFSPVSEVDGTGSPVEVPLAPLEGNGSAAFYRGSVRMAPEEPEPVATRPGFPRMPQSWDP